MVMRPNRIILVRHGESVGNVDSSIYTSTPDYAIRLTEQGRLQAQEAGREINKIIGPKTKGPYGNDAQFYVSSYTRTKETYQNIISTLDIRDFKVREDPRIREQEWRGNLGAADYGMEDERDAFGHFFYRFPGGESCADVYDRVSNFFDTMFRDFEKTEFPENAIIVSHGMALRVFLMRFFHMPIEQFERLRNPKNCGIFVLERDPKNSRGHYKLTKELEMHPEPTHPYHFPI